MEHRKIGINPPPPEGERPVEHANPALNQPAAAQQQGSEAGENITPGRIKKKRERKSLSKLCRLISVMLIIYYAVLFTVIFAPRYVRNVWESTKKPPARTSQDRGSRSWDTSKIGQGLNRFWRHVNSAPSSDESLSYDAHRDRVMRYLTMTKQDRGVQPIVLTITYIRQDAVKSTSVPLSDLPQKVAGKIHDAIDPKLAEISKEGTSILDWVSSQKTTLKSGGTSSASARTYKSSALGKLPEQTTRAAESLKNLFEDLADHLSPSKSKSGSKEWIASHTDLDKLTDRMKNMFDNLAMPAFASSLKAEAINLDPKHIIQAKIAAASKKAEALLKSLKDEIKKSGPSSSTLDPILHKLKDTTADVYGMVEEAERMGHKIGDKIEDALPMNQEPSLGGHQARLVKSSMRAVSKELAKFSATTVMQESSSTRGKHAFEEYWSTHRLSGPPTVRPRSHTKAGYHSIAKPTTTTSILGSSNPPRKRVPKKGTSKKDGKKESPMLKHSYASSSVYKKVGEASAAQNDVTMKPIWYWRLMSKVGIPESLPIGTGTSARPGKAHQISQGKQERSSFGQANTRVDPSHAFLDSIIKSVHYHDLLSSLKHHGRSWGNHTSNLLDFSWIWKALASFRQSMYSLSSNFKPNLNVRDIAGARLTNWESQLFKPIRDQTPEEKAWEEKFFDERHHQYGASKTKSVDSLLDISGTLYSVIDQLMAEGNQHYGTMTDLQDAWDRLHRPESVINASETVKKLASETENRNLLRSYPGVVHQFDRLVNDVADATARMATSAERTLDDVAQWNVMRDAFDNFLREVRMRPSFIKMGFSSSDGFHRDILLGGREKLESVRGKVERLK